MKFKTNNPMVQRKLSKELKKGFEKRIGRCDPIGEWSKSLNQGKLWSSVDLVIICDHLLAWCAPSCDHLLTWWSSGDHPGDHLLTWCAPRQHVKVPAAPAAAECSIDDCCQGTWVDWPTWASNIRDAKKQRELYGYFLNQDSFLKQFTKFINCVTFRGSRRIRKNKSFGKESMDCNLFVTDTIKSQTALTQRFLGSL